MITNFFEGIGAYALLMTKVFRRPDRWKLFYRALVKEIQLLGLDSIGIVVILSVFMGGVVTIQTAFQLSDDPLIPTYYIAMATRESITLEFSPTVVSLILAGKVGSNVASSLGTMRVSEQIDALEVMGVNSASFLILPKIVAQLIFNPILIIMSLFLGLWGGAMAGDLLGLVPFEESIMGYRLEFIPFENAFYALIKTVVFAFIIGSVSAYSGYTVKGGAVEVGVASTNAVVRSCLAIILANYLLTDLILTS
ncbi:MAG: ABC transporter permease [Schleiferiaceae bacterium]|jgi:phospholipid/cholesterol/gamma-HCH transport system permease protein|nr:ABC transporter permease [Bacteroidota bacterium]MCH1406769.1 ABC transporter permease [Schleiferiaceae bacterium]MCO4775356.1 ABC transporter permease [Flavobacteriales bacterium]MCH9809897.1 ABC transporter permease [Bacteroidota bacterium]MCO4790935.1 ABC transporter permease [Flavobacteriales bacterium]